MKLERIDGTKIWKEFSKYSCHDDLKDLYKIVNPEIAKFEQKIMDYSGDTEKMKIIIRRFDEDLAMKSNKHQIKVIYDYIDTNCALKKIQDKQVEEYN
jgi:hypothetical protein